MGAVCCCSEGRIHYQQHRLAGSRILLSPKPVTDNLRNLLVVYGRYDILEYDQDGNRIMIVQWDAARCAIMHGATLPPGEHL